MDKSFSFKRDKNKIRITNVWKDNLEAEFEKMTKLVVDYPFIAMDTEFPGIVAKPTGQFSSSSEYQYQTMRCNVNLCKIIQIGLTFANERGEIPEDGYCSWQFNFAFDLEKDVYAQDSIDLLIQSGIDFNKLKTNGIDPQDFAELLTVSGFVYTKETRWLTFHSAYDFGYLMRLLYNQPLPDTEMGFFQLFSIIFPIIYDIKYLMRNCENLRGGLAKISQELGCKRFGIAHQAGSDSLLTCDTFFQMMKIFFENHYDDEKYIGVLYGIGDGFVNSHNTMITEPKKYFQSLSYTPYAKNEKSLPSVEIPEDTSGNLRTSNTKSNVNSFVNSQFNVNSFLELAQK